MPIIKTGISIEKELFIKAEETAAKLNVSRSRFFQLALENYMLQIESMSIFNRLNKVYSGQVSEDEQNLQKIMKDYLKNHREDDWQ
jgi:metal-responsive CopG/Arc/MetJ family transcriptional regulator